MHRYQIMICIIFELIHGETQIHTFIALIKRAEYISCNAYTYHQSKQLGTERSVSKITVQCLGTSTAPKINI